jgi:hypothetical protein
VPLNWHYSSSCSSSDSSISSRPQQRSLTSLHVLFRVAVVTVVAQGVLAAADTVASVADTAIGAIANDAALQATLDEKQKL